MTFNVPIRTRSTNHGNGREHWASRARRVKAERSATMAAWYGAKRKVTLPCVVTLTRIAPRQMDGDNLQGALKGVRDQVAQQLGVDDRDARVTWVYGQERGKPRTYAVRVHVSSGPCALARQGIVCDGACSEHKAGV